LPLRTGAIYRARFNAPVWRAGRNKLRPYVGWIHGHVALSRRGRDVCPPLRRLADLVVGEALDGGDEGGVVEVATAGGGHGVEELADDGGNR